MIVFFFVLQELFDDAQQEPLTDDVVRTFMASLPASTAVVNDHDDDDDDDHHHHHHHNSLYINANPRPTLRGDADEEDMDDPQRDLSMVRDAIRKDCGCLLNCVSTIPDAKILDNILTLSEIIKDTKETYILSKTIPIESVSRCSKQSRPRKRCHLFYASQKHSEADAEPCV